MDKTKLLLISIGQGGGNIVDGLMSLNKRYNGLFINSSIGDINPLKNANIKKNVYIYPYADGSGRNMDKSKAMFIENSNPIGTLLRKFPQVELVTTVIAMAGGTGAGSVSSFVKLCKKALPNAKINLVAILPSLTEDEIALKNCLSCWKEINKVIDLISDIKFVDNSKRNNYAEINKEVIECLDLAYNVTSSHIDGTIDLDDSMRINTCDGYGMVLKLPNSASNSKDAIDIAIEQSIFAPTDNFECDYLAINIKSDGYDVDKIASEFDVFKTTYKTYNNNSNFLVLGGLSIPSESLEMIKMTLDDKENKKKSRVKNKGFVIDVEDKKETKSKKEEVIIYDDNEDFDDIFNDDFLND